MYRWVQYWYMGTYMNTPHGEPVEVRLLVVEFPYDVVRCAPGVSTVKGPCHVSEVTHHINTLAILAHRRVATRGRVRDIVAIVRRAVKCIPVLNNRQFASEKRVYAPAAQASS